MPNIYLCKDRRRGPLLALYKIVKGGFANPCPDTDIYFPICHSYDHDTISLWLITNLFDYFFDWMFCSNYLHSYKQYIFYALGCLENTSLEVWGESPRQQMCGRKGGWPCKYPFFKEIWYALANYPFIDFKGLHTVKLKFVYSEKATKFCEIFHFLLTVTFVHAIWSYKEGSYKEPALRFWKKIKNQQWEFWT